MSAELTTGAEWLNHSVDEQGIKLIFTPSRRKKIKKINIGIEGVFTLHNTALVLEKITPVLNSFDTIDIALKNIEQIDLAAVQLLHHLKKTAAAGDKQVLLDAELQKEDRLLLFNAGLMGLLTKTKLTD